MIPTLFTSLISLITGWFNGQLEVQKSKIETQKAAEANKARLLSDEQSNNHAWEMAELTGADKTIRRASFICFSAPFVVAIFAPESVKHYFDVAIASIPAWYKATYMSITGAIWGISSLKNPVSQLISHFKGK